MATALANVSDDWVQRAFAAELGGKSVGGGAMGNVLEHMQHSVVAVIMVFLLWNTIAIVSVVATPKHRGSTKSLGTWAMVASIVEIILYAGCLFFFYKDLDNGDPAFLKQIFIINWLMFASVSSGLHVALLLQSSKLKKVSDIFFNGTRLILFAAIFGFTVLTFPQYQGKGTPVFVFIAVMFTLLAILAGVKSNKKATIGLLSFFSVLGMVVMIAVFFTVIAV
jgi:hypothetical protein